MENVHKYFDSDSNTLEFRGIRFGHIKHDSDMFLPNKRPLFYRENVSGMNV